MVGQVREGGTGDSGFLRRVLRACDHGWFEGQRLWWDCPAVNAPETSVTLKLHEVFAQRLPGHVEQVRHLSGVDAAVLAQLEEDALISLVGMRSTGGVVIYPHASVPSSMGLNCIGRGVSSLSDWAAEGVSV